MGFSHAYQANPSCPYYNCYTFTLAEEDFTAGQYNVTFLPNTTQATVNISLQIDDIDEGPEYFILHLYITSATYELGVQPGDVTKAIAIIFSPCTYVCNGVVTYVCILVT